MKYYRKLANGQLKAMTPPFVVGGETISEPSAEQFALFSAYPLADPMPSAPTPPQGKVAVPDGYELVDSAWQQAYRFDDIPAPTLADFDAAMEEHLRTECEARGYTTREPDAYANSQVPRWKQDAEDWVAHRDAVMLYAQEILNAVQSGQRQPPTMAEFEAGLPQIVWSYTEG